MEAVVFVRKSMQTLFFFIVLGCIVRFESQAQEPGTIPWTPKVTSGLSQVSIKVPPQYASVGISPTQHKIWIPTGWTATIFFAGSALKKPRFMSWGPDSVLYVANMNGNNVLALPDRNKDGIADTAYVASREFSYGHDVRFRRDTMFVLQESGLVKLWRSDPNTFDYDRRQIIIDKNAQTNQIGGNHRTRTLVIDTIRGKYYISVGSRGNADRESNRAVIEEYEFDGSGRRIFASGVRNAVGMTLHPRTGQLWATNNGSDNQGNDVPPEWVDIVRDGGFYGYPFAYHFRRWFNFVLDYSDLLPITMQDSALVTRMVPPAALVEAHCAPMALVFAEDGARPEHRYGAFMAMRGSWDRQPPSGAKIVFFPFDNDADTIANSVQDFCTGFITDTNNVASRWARPVGIALGSDGSVYVSSDDIKQFIIKLTPPLASSVDQGDAILDSVFPNPADESVTCNVSGSGILVQCYTLNGSVIAEKMSQSHVVRFDTTSWPVGTYVISVTNPVVGTMQSHQIVISR